MAANTSLVAYDSDSSNEEIDTKGSGDDGEDIRDDAVDISALKSKILLNSAPVVTAKVEVKLARCSVMLGLIAYRRVYHPGPSCSKLV